jgi:hypothetical protein
MEAYELVLYFKSPTMTVREYIDFSKDILTKLAKFDPIFRHLFGWGMKANARRQIAPDMSDFDEIVYNQIDDKSIAYSKPDANNNEFTWDSTCFIGYRNSYSNTTRVKEGKISITIDAGKDTHPGILIIKFPEYNYHRFNDYQFVRNLFLTCIEMLNPIYGHIISDGLIDINHHDKNEIYIGWFTYLSKKHILKKLPKDIQIEDMQNGTLLLSSEEIPDTTDTEVEYRIKEITKSLINEQLSNKSAYI